ncbi:MAG: cytidine deaminase [Crocinitomicaceae bacterium]|nr:cytidine deaminase [Crocinitomicaceae bacterium]MBK8925279.1 cytidine deaminase [Crocinitomicaceae bacterium]
MKTEKQIHISYKISDTPKDFSEDQQAIIQLAKDMAANAYAPYSNFHVTAIALLKSGKVVKGTNVENASYPVGICAERNVLSHCISNYPEDKITCLAIYADQDLGQPVPPCGLCRQTLLEAEQRQKNPIELLLIAKNGTIFQINSCADLLPLNFNSGFLKK